jgi:hypothetical protein
MEKLFSVYEKSGTPTQRLSIYRTVSPENPREIFENYWTLFCQHPHLKLGDEREFGLEELKDEEETLVVDLFNHSGALKTYRAHKRGCRKVGVAVAFKNSIVNNLGAKESNWEEKAMEILKEELDVYNAYLKGEVYYCKLTEITTCECCKQKIETFVDIFGDFYGLAHLEKSLKDVFNLKEFKDVWGERL